MRSFLSAGMAIVVIVATACSSPTTRVCSPGVSVACVGVGGCSGGQSCKSDGSAFEPCQCAGTDAGTPKDAASDATNDSGPTAFSPTDLSTLVIWLEGDVGVVTSNISVTAWPNQAPNGVPVTPCALKPTAVKGAANGHDAVHFDNACLTSPDDARLQWATDDFTVEAVVRVVATTKLGSFWSKGTSASFFLDVKAVSQVAGYYGGSSVGPVLPFGADNAFHMVGMRRIGASLEIRVNGIGKSVALTTALDGSSLGHPLYVGMVDPQAANNDWFVGDIAELVAVHGTTSDANVGKLESYFRQKYALQ